MADYNLYSYLSDNELIEATEQALDDAHNAPKSVAGKENDAWRTKSARWIALAHEMKRRGLEQS